MISRIWLWILEVALYEHIGFSLWDKIYVYVDSLYVLIGFSWWDKIAVCVVCMVDADIDCFTLPWRLRRFVCEPS